MLYSVQTDLRTSSLMVHFVVCIVQVVSSAETRRKVMLAMMMKTKI